MAESSVLNLLAKTTSKDGLTADLARSVNTWMCAAVPSAVDDAWNSYLQLLIQTDAKLHPASGATKASDNVWNLMSSITSSGSPQHTPASFALLPHPPSFPLVRLATHVVIFSPIHAAGPRGLPPGAAGRPPGRLAVLPGASTLQLPIDGQGGRARSASAAGPGVHSQGQPAILQPCPIHTPLECALQLRNVGRTKAMVSVRPLQTILDGGCGFMSVEPPGLVLGRGEKGSVTVQLRLLHPGRQVRGLILIETEGGHRQLAMVRALTECTVFGVELSDVPCHSGVSWIGEYGVPHHHSPLHGGGRGFAGLPQPLVQLESRLVADECAALAEEGIFRVAPGESEKQAIRGRLDTGLPLLSEVTGQPHACTGIAAATMIKVFLRELPSPLFHEVRTLPSSPVTLCSALTSPSLHGRLQIPKEMLLQAQIDDEESVSRAVAYVTGANSVMLRWLVALLVHVSTYSDRNKMSLKALAICTGPNLFYTDESINPMEALMISQKAVAFLLRLCMIADRQRVTLTGTATRASASLADPTVQFLPPARTPIGTPQQPQDDQQSGAVQAPVSSALLPARGHVAPLSFRATDGTSSRASMSEGHGVG